MSTQAVAYCTSKKLNCCPPAQVILCVPSSLTVSGKASIEATLSYAFPTTSSCFGCSYQYTFEYDDSQLIDQSVPLTTASISGVICRDCFTIWVEQSLSLGLTGWSTDAIGNFTQDEDSAGAITFSDSQGLIRQDTFDGADNKSIAIAGGGEASITRGAFIETFGNEAPGVNAGDINLNVGNVAGATIKVSGSIIHSVTSFILAPNTVDGADTYSTSLCGGGTVDVIRGAFVTCYGNEAVGADAGDLYLSCGNVAGATIQISGNVVHTGSFTYHDNPFLIVADSVDGADTSAIAISGGGAVSTARGGTAIFRGNESATAEKGYASLYSGNIANSKVLLGLGIASSVIEFQNASSGAMWTVNNSGQIIQDVTNGGDIVFGKATSAFQLQSGANGRTGTFTMNGATPVVVSNTSLAAGDMITIEQDTPAGTPGPWNLTARTNGASFTVTGTAADTSGMRYTLTQIN